MPLFETDLRVTVDAGGDEDGSVTWVGSPVEYYCKTDDFTDTQESVTVDTTARCDTLETSRGIRIKRNVEHTLDALDDGTFVYAAVNKYYKLTLKWLSSGSSVVLTCATRSVSNTSGRGNKTRQTVRLEVQAVA